jgi:DNA-binding response OmpR family regulator
MSTTEGRSTVLVVDDTPADVSGLLEVLTREGFETFVASDSESALAQAQRAMPDLILLNQNISGIDGLETCRRLKADPATREIPVILMTARSEGADRIECFAAGAADYVVKPLRHDEVLVRVRMQLGLRRLGREVQDLNRDREAQVAERTVELRAALDELARLNRALQEDKARLEAQLREQIPDTVGGTQHLPETLAHPALIAPTEQTVLVPAEMSAGATLTLQEAQRRHVLAVLKQARGVIEGPRGAAKLLDLKPSTLRFRIRKLGIQKTDYQD